MPRIFSTSGWSIRQLMQQTALIVRDEVVCGKRVFIVVDSAFRGEAVVRQLSKIEVQGVFLDAYDRQEAEIARQKFAAGELGVVVSASRPQPGIKVDTLIACGCELCDADIILSGRQSCSEAAVPPERSTQAAMPQYDEAPRAEQKAESVQGKAVQMQPKGKQNRISRRFVLLLALVAFLVGIVRVAGRA